MKFGDNLINLRKLKKISQEKLAEKMEYQGRVYQNGRMEKVIQKWKK